MFNPRPLNAAEFLRDLGLVLRQRMRRMVGARRALLFLQALRWDSRFGSSVHEPRVIGPAPCIPLVDAHFHLDLFPDPAAIAREIEAAHIHTIAVTNTPSVLFHTRALAQGCRFLHPAVGLHPQLVGARAGELDSIWPLLEETRFVGEVGLDYVTKDENDRRLQRDVFAKVLERCASIGNRIITVHSRRSARDVIGAVGDAFPLRLHWPSGDSYHTSEQSRPSHRRKVRTR